MLQRLEGQSRRALHSQNAWVVDEADKTRAIYRPHITVLPTGIAHEGDIIVCSKLYLVEQFGEYKEAQAIMPLNT